MFVAGFHSLSSGFGSSFLCDSQPATRASSILQMWRELENEHTVSSQSCSNNINRSNRQPRNGSDTECSTTPKSVNGDDTSRYSYEFEYEENNSVVSEDLGETERERVRQIFQEWTRGGSKGNLSVRPVRRLCGRQTLLDVLMRAQSERKRELLGLDERRPVSEFVHRNRIQALLKGRFLRNEKPVLDERPSSRAATELGLLCQRQTVSDLREGFLSKSGNSSFNSSHCAELNSTCKNNVKTESTFREGQEDAEIHRTSVSESGNTNTQTEADDQDVPHGLDTQDLTLVNVSEHVDYSIANDVSNEVYEEFDSQDALAQVEGFLESVVEIEGSVWQHQRSGDSRDNGEEGSAYAEPFGNNVEEQEDLTQDLHVDWPSHGLQEAIDSWLDVLPSGRSDVFYPPDDGDHDGDHSMEIRELINWRPVSSLLGSGFRESLNKVLQSHVERLARASGEIESDDVSLIEGDHEEINGTDQTSVLSDGSQRNPLWDEEFQGTRNSSHHNSDYCMEQLQTEWDVINELRIDMARLQQRMNNMQSMLEACMQIQLELQRAVLEEVFAALNRSRLSRDEEEEKEDEASCTQLHDESHWDHVRKGICCICRDGKIDSLLYRCGHMCTCSKCADDLVLCKGECPMCQAPAVEAVQAYFIQ